MTQHDYLQLADEVIARGPFKDTWESLTEYEVASWYKKAKFGIFIHWGVYSVPAFGSEWYPRDMYWDDTEVFKHHKETYGDHKTFGYKDFVPMFKAEKFNPKEWAELFKKAGAKYVTPVAEHHDGFQMYGSDLCCWNAVEMGPKRDVLGELKQEIEDRDMVFCASSHRAEHFWFFSGGLSFPSDVTDPEAADLYGPPHEAPVDSHKLNDLPPTKEFMDDWLARSVELVEKYNPKLVFFDWWIINMAWKPHLRKFAAYYYNRAKERGVEVAINYKYDAYAYNSAVYDIERGQLKNINPRLWQNDTSIAKNSWGYTENNDFKDANSLICDLVDITSKNGCLMLNIGPKSDGTICDEEKAVLLEIGAWLEKNGEGIYDTTYFRTYGEGPTLVEDGYFIDTERANFTSEDIRFTYKKGAIYAFALANPEDGIVKIKSLAEASLNLYTEIKSIELLGYEIPIEFSRDKEALTIALKGKVETKNPICFKIIID